MSSNCNYGVENHWALTLILSSFLAQYNTEVDKWEDATQFYLIRIPGKSS